jgi:hypothetical protein
MKLDAYSGFFDDLNAAAKCFRDDEAEVLGVTLRQLDHLAARNGRNGSKLPHWRLWCFPVLLRNQHILWAIYTILKSEETVLILDIGAEPCKSFLRRPKSPSRDACELAKNRLRRSNR